jgi:hypothetical protein
MIVKGVCLARGSEADKMVTRDGHVGYLLGPKTSLNLGL